MNQLRHILSNTNKTNNSSSTRDENAIILSYSTEPKSILPKHKLNLFRNKNRANIYVKSKLKKTNVHLLYLSFSLSL